jgi:hypothetical protein
VLTVQAIAGTHVVLLGMNVDESLVKGLLGFAIERTDHTEGERYFLPNFLLFKANDVGTDPDHSSELNPVQEFVWGDYTAKPNHVYSYAVTAMHGTPAKLEPGATATVRVDTEDPDDGTHGIYFNRGVVASQAYQRRFGPVAPSVVANREAYKWLSRGLEEGILAFIGQAVDERYALRAALDDLTPTFSKGRPPKNTRTTIFSPRTEQVQAVRRDPSNVVGAGGVKAKGGWRRWIADGLRNPNGRVDYVHTNARRQALRRPACDHRLGELERRIDQEKR